MKQIIALITLGFLLLSCSSNRNQTQSSFIDLEREDNVSVFDIFESVDLIPLETNEQSLIAVIDKVIYFNDRYYILDIKQQVLFCFDSAGKFLFRISQRGHAPEEYLRLEDFNIDSYNNQLLLLEPYGHLLVFDLDGQFISKTRLPSEVHAYNEVFPLDTNRIVFSSLYNFELVFYNRSKNIIYDRRYGARDEKITNANFMPVRCTYYYNGHLYFSPQPSNEIINLSDSTVFSWDFGKRTNTKEVIENMENFILTTKIDVRPKERPYYEQYDWIGEEILGNIPFFNFESSRYRFCALQTKHNFMKYIFYDKKTEKAFVFDKTKEGICFGIPECNEESIIMCERGWWKKTGNPDIDKDHVYYNPDIFTDEQKQLLKSGRDDDNPFLVKYNFKQ